MTEVEQLQQEMKQFAEVSAKVSQAQFEALSDLKKEVYALECFLKGALEVLGMDDKKYHEMKAKLLADMDQQEAKHRDEFINSLSPEDQAIFKAMRDQL